MSDQATNLDRLFDLVGAVCDDGASSNDLAELDSIVRADGAARDWYLRYCRAHSTLRLELRAHRNAQAVFEQIGIQSTADGLSQFDVAGKAETPSSPIPTFLFTTFPGTVGLSSDWPLAYLLATVITGLGLLVGSHVYMSRPEQLATHITPPAAERQLAPEPQPRLVGRITGMVACKWVEEKSEIRNPKSEGISKSPSLQISKSLVSLGDRLALASGLMEITYDTGAKVILQGPVTYEVESNGGYLSLGKLTGKLEKGSGFRVQGSESTNLPISKFTIHTPTATVTDLGTEFGVEVGKDQSCELHVFQGAVEAVPMDGAKPVGPPRRFVAGQGARVKRGVAGASENRRVTFTAFSANPKAFVQVMPVRCGHSKPKISVEAGDMGQFQAANNDLINAGQPTASAIEVKGRVLYGSTINALIDGTVYGGGPPCGGYASFMPAAGTVATVILNTRLHPAGYDIESIVSLTGSVGDSSQDRSSQKYDLAYSLGESPNRFVRIKGDSDATVNRNAHCPEVRVTVAGEHAPPISGAAKLRFTFHDTESVHRESMYREIDVFGKPSPPALEQSLIQSYGGSNRVSKTNRVDPQIDKKGDITDKHDSLR